MRALAVLALSLLAACGAQPDGPPGPNPDTADAAPSPVLAIDEITGRWRVVSIDGDAPVKRGGGSGEPYLSITQNSVGGSIGCNNFGALTLFADGRFAAHGWGGEARYCNGIAEREQALSELFFSRPQVERTGNGLRIRSKEHEVILADRGPPERESFDLPAQTLANTRWTISFLDRSEASSSPDDRVLTFTKDSWRGLASCATLFGTYRREDNRLIVGKDIATTEQNCPPEYAARDDAFADLMRSDPRYLIGPNGELILAGGGHYLTGGEAG